MTSLTIERKQTVQDSEEIEEEILLVLIQRGALMLDHLERTLPNIEGARLLLAIDRLSRAGRIAIGPPRNGDYLVWAVPGESPVYVAF
jgi:hypothetical protein